MAAARAKNIRVRFHARDFDREGRDPRELAGIWPREAAEGVGWGEDAESPPDDGSDAASEAPSESCEGEDPAPQASGGAVGGSAGPGARSDSDKGEPDGAAPGARQADSPGLPGGAEALRGVCPRKKWQLRRVVNNVPPRSDIDKVGLTYTGPSGRIGVSFRLAILRLLSCSQVDLTEFGMSERGVRSLAAALRYAFAAVLRNRTFNRLDLKVAARPSTPPAAFSLCLSVCLSVCRRRARA